MGKFKEKLANLKEQISNLDNLSVDINDAKEFKEFYLEYWPKISAVLTFVKEQKVTRRRADKKLQAAIDEGEKVFKTLNDPAKLDAALDSFSDTLDSIEAKLDKVISTLQLIDKMFKEDTNFDNLLEKTVDFLTKVNHILNEVDEKIEGLKS